MYELGHNMQINPWKSAWIYIITFAFINNCKATLYVSKYSQHSSFQQ